jgi:hypothetical protein
METEENPAYAASMHWITTTELLAQLRDRGGPRAGCHGDVHCGGMARHHAHVLVTISSSDCASFLHALQYVDG